MFHHDLAALLAGWDNFYVIVGSAGGALTGLMFVVIALSGETRQREGVIQAIRAFSTPTVVHFGGVLLIAAVVATPGHSIFTLSACIAICGAVGLWFSAWVAQQMRKTTAVYTPVADDWLFHIILPAVAYAALILAAAGLWWRPSWALVLIAAAVVFILFVGIHNAWDAAIYVSVRRGEDLFKP